MTGAAATMPRGRCHGLRQIVRFNWPFYALAAAFTVSAPWLARACPRGLVSDLLWQSGVALASAWMFGSLAASWIVYDRSPLMAGAWIPPALGFRPDSWVNIHAGLDEWTPILRRVLGGARGRVLDIFDAAEMTEPSIARARRLARSTGRSEPADFRRLPLPASSIDAAFLLLSAHELRTDSARRALFEEIHRVLSRGGRAIVAEHLRDGPNAMAFGPGALHFHSRRTWTRSFEGTGFAIHREFSITPFVRIFVIGRRP